MNKRSLVQIATLLFLAILLMMPAAEAISLPDTAKFEITWLQSVYKSSSASTPLAYTIQPDGTMEVRADKNYPTASQFQLLFSYGGSDQNYLETGAIQMRIPRSIFVDGAGASLDTIALGIPLAPATGIDTDYHYYIDGDEVVITNFKPVTEATFFSTKIEYVVSPPKVPVSTRPLCRDAV